MITVKEIVRLHKLNFPSPKIGTKLKCKFCKAEFEAWFGILGQDMRGRTNCCKFCLDKLRNDLNGDSRNVVENFHLGFRKKSDKNAFLGLTYKQKLRYIKDVVDAGIVICPPRKGK